MNVQHIQFSPEDAAAALREYKQHRGSYDKADWEIERIYREIARGKTVMSALQAIRDGGLDEFGRPRLAIMRADQSMCTCELYSSTHVLLCNQNRSRAAEWYFEIPWPNRPVPREITGRTQYRHMARLPRIPPQHRPIHRLSDYHLLWEANWENIPTDPYLLKRIGKDAWIVLAAWELTPVEVSVLRARAQ